MKTENSKKAAGIAAGSSNLTPTADELAAARAKHWHQDGNPLLSQEGLREFLQRSGLIFWAPKEALGAPAPTLVEAVLGKPGTPEVGELDTPKSLLARLVAEGSAVPLNLLGATGAMGTDVPDFVASAAVFSYIFTLRGNKAWKLPPETSGPVKVSPLALATYEMLQAKVTLSAYDLTTQLGKEVTEAAVLRALTELWSQLRVLPVPQQDGSATLWELASARFTKQIKAGANAGQPSALSALISLYLGQAVLATEDEIESFLSPLAARSRVRDVIHALLGARQLETLVIDGKTLLHVSGELAALKAAMEVKADEAEVSPEENAPDAEVMPLGEAIEGSRIRKFTPKPGSKLGTGLRAKPTFGAKPYGTRPAFGSKPPFGERPAFGSGDRERRPFRRDDGAGPSRPYRTSGPAKPSFDKPWQEDRRPRPSAGGENGDRPERTFTPRPKPYGDRPSREGFTPRPKPYGDRPGSGGFSARPKPYGDRPDREGFTPRPKPYGDRPSREGFTPRPKPFGDRPNGGGFTSRPKPFGAKPFGDRPPRREFGSREGSGAGFGQDSDQKRPYSKPGGFARKPFGDRPERSDRPAPRRDFTAGAESGGDRGGDRGYGGAKRPGSYTPRPASGYQGNRSSSGEGGEAPKRVYRKFDAPKFGPKDGGREGGGGAGGKKPYSKPGGGAFAGKGGPFAKFADGKKPFRKPGPPKKAGGFGPSKRKRDGAGE